MRVVRILTWRLQGCRRHLQRELDGKLLYVELAVTSSNSRSFFHDSCTTQEKSSVRRTKSLMPDSEVHSFLALVAGATEDVRLPQDLAPAFQTGPRLGAGPQTCPTGHLSPQLFCNWAPSHSNFCSTACCRETEGPSIHQIQVAFLSSGLVLADTPTFQLPQNHTLELSTGEGL